MLGLLFEVDVVLVVSDISQEFIEFEMWFVWQVYQICLVGVVVVIKIDLYLCWWEIVNVNVVYLQWVWVLMLIIVVLLLLCSYVVMFNDKEFNEEFNFLVIVKFFSEQVFFCVME